MLVGRLAHDGLWRPPTSRADGGRGVTDSGVSPGREAAEDLEAAAAVFPSLRPRLFGIAYRMLSSASEAEDLVPSPRFTRAPTRTRSSYATSWPRGTRS